MFKWIARLFSRKRDVDETTVIELSQKKPYKGILETNDNFRKNMPLIIENPDQVDTSNIMIDDGRGNMVQASPQQMQAMMYRPNNYEGLPGMRKPQQNQPRPQQRTQMQQPYNQQAQDWQAQQQWNQPPQQQQPYYPNQPMAQGYPPPPPPPQNIQQPPRKLYPIFELYTIDNEYHLEIDLPGIDEQSLTIEYADSIVTVGGTRELAVDKLKRGKSKKKDMPITDVQSTIPSHLLGKFSFDFPFKKLVDESNISADYIAGVLHITLPHRVKGDKVSIGIKKNATLN